MTRKRNIASALVAFAAIAACTSHQVRAEGSDVLGSYAQGEAHAGVVKSGTAQVLTKGDVSLALAGNGEGVDLGIDIGKFTLSRRN